MATASETVVEISLEVECPHERDGCRSHARNLLEVLDNGRYDRCSVMKLPRSLDEWMGEHRTARKRGARAGRLGYRFKTILRHERVDEVFAINTSMPDRQGRPMSKGYHERPSETPLPAYACDRHAIHTYGVVDDSDVLVAYLWMYRAGDLALVSSILGHAEHLDNGVMYLLMAGAIGQELERGPGLLVYNRHDSGTDGLRFYKERCGLEERLVRWRP